MRRRVNLGPEPDEESNRPPDRSSATTGGDRESEPALPVPAPVYSSNLPVFSGLHDACRKLAGHEARRTYRLWMAFRRALESVEVSECHREGVFAATRRRICKRRVALPRLGQPPGLGRESSILRPQNLGGILRKTLESSIPSIRPKFTAQPPNRPTA